MVMAIKAPQAGENDHRHSEYYLPSLRVRNGGKPAGRSVRLFLQVPGLRRSPEAERR